MNLTVKKAMSASHDNKIVRSYGRLMNPMCKPVMLYSEIPENLLTSIIWIIIRKLTTNDRMYYKLTKKEKTIFLANYGLISFVIKS